MPSGIPGTLAGQGRGWKNWAVEAEAVENGVEAVPSEKGRRDKAEAVGKVELLEPGAGARYVDMIQMCFIQVM